MIKTIHHWTHYHAEDFNFLSENNEETTGFAILGYYEFQYDSLVTVEFFESIIDLANKLEVPLYILTLYDHRYNEPLLDFNNPKYRNVKIVTWPEGVIVKAYDWLCALDVYEHNMSIGLDLHKIKATEEIENFKYPFISLIRLPRPHRCLYMDLLANHDLIKMGAVGWREWSNYHFRYWNQEILIVDQSVENPRNDFMHMCLPEAVTKSFMQVVPETDPHIFAITEKTAYPIFFGKPFLVVGCPNYHAILEKMGFKLYDEIFDYSFDSIKDMKIRYEGLIKNVARVCNKKPEKWRKMYELVSEKIEYNKLHALNIARNYNNYPNVWKEIATQQGHVCEPVDVLISMKNHVDRYLIKE